MRKCVEVYTGGEFLYFTQGWIVQFVIYCVLKIEKIGDIIQTQRGDTNVQVNPKAQTKTKAYEPNQDDPL